VLVTVRGALGGCARDDGLTGMATARCGAADSEVDAFTVLDARDVRGRSRVNPGRRVAQQHDDGDRRGGEARS
jgi:hypothetical protein